LSPKQQAIAVEGLNETVRALKAIGVPAKEIKAASKQAADLVANSARAIAPNRTGALSRSIKSAALLKGAVVRAGNNSVPYSNPIHWGWFFDKKNNHKRNIKPQPFFVKALGYRRQDIIDTFEKNMKKLIHTEEAKQKTIRTHK
jgi:HK97 gp10 family phage protein